MFFSRIRDKRGGTIIIIVMMLALLFPVIITGILDLANIFTIQKKLKTSLNAATKSASTRIDWEYVPDGEFLIDKSAAETAFLDIFSLNTNRELLKDGEDIYKSEEKKNGGDLWVYFKVYNERHEDDFEKYPEEGSIPKEVTEKGLFALVDRPTAIGIAKAEYKLSITMGNKTIDIVELASSQLNVSPDIINWQPTESEEQEIEDKLKDDNRFQEWEG